MTHLKITLAKRVLKTFMIILLISFSNLNAQNFNFGIKAG